MKKFILTTIFCLSSCIAYANSPIPSLEKRVKERYKDGTILCDDIDNKSDKKKIDCLFKMVQYLQAKIDLNYNYYINTLTITNVGCYNGDIKNCWE